MSSLSGTERVGVEGRREARNDRVNLGELGCKCGISEPVETNRVKQTEKGSDEDNSERVLTHLVNHVSQPTYIVMAGNLQTR